MHRHKSFVVPAFALAAGLVFAACESSTSNSCGTGTPPSLVGTYALVSATFGTDSFSTGQGYSGALQFTSTRYNFSVSASNVTVLADSGTYAVSGAKCISETSETGSPQFTGTFTLSGTTAGATLTVAGSAAGLPVKFIATKQ
jgi:hypothetical protein